MQNPCTVFWLLPIQPKSSHMSSLSYLHVIFYLLAPNPPKTHRSTNDIFHYNAPKVAYKLFEKIFNMIYKSCIYRKYI